MAKNKKNMSKKELEKEGREHGIELDRRHSKEDLIDELEAVEAEEKEAVTVGDVLDQIVEESEIEETVEKTDIREIAKKAVESKGVEATEQHINDYIERFNLV
jgi:5'-deoxynucleotidase YfbR-like HD superfamily hydrolase|tara:strand:+ start:224 stop:532 length:309 start_codon:yes stop_codon:yes gene_type:complete